MQLTAIHFIKESLIGDVLTHHSRNHIATNAHKTVVRIDVIERGILRVIESIEDKFANSGSGFQPSRLIGGAPHLMCDRRQGNPAQADMAQGNMAFETNRHRSLPFVQDLLSQLLLTQVSQAGRRLASGGLSHLRR